MTADQALAFIVFATVGAITPGPSNLILTSTGAAVGVLRGLASLLGVAIGMGVLMFLVALGLGRLVLERPVLVAGLKWGGAAFLLWLAWTIASAPPGAAAGKPEVVGFWRAAAFQWINPKSWLACASAAGTYLQTEAGNVFEQSLAFGMLFVLAALPSCFLWLAGGAAVQRVLRTERASRMFNMVMGGLLVGSVLLVLR